MFTTEDNKLILTEDNRILSIELESNISKLAKIRRKIKELVAEEKMIRTQLINEYFYENDIYQNKKGFVMATYFLEKRNQFQTDKFKKDKPVIYKSYCVETEVRKLSTK